MNKERRGVFWKLNYVYFKPEKNLLGIEDSKIKIKLPQLITLTDVMFESQSLLAQVNGYLSPRVDIQNSVFNLLSHIN